MKIAVLSDTHVGSIDSFPRKILDELSGMDLTIHAGDYTEKKVLDGLRKLGNFKGVHGNMDSWEIKRELPSVETVEVGNHRIGINHPAEGGPALGLEDRIRVKFQDVSVIIFGHTHLAENAYRNGLLYFNPGSATGTFPALKKTFGILTVEKEIRGEILKL